MHYLIYLNYSDPITHDGIMDMAQSLEEAREMKAELSCDAEEGQQYNIQPSPDNMDDVDTCSLWCDEKEEWKGGISNA